MNELREYTDIGRRVAINNDIESIDVDDISVGTYVYVVLPRNSRIIASPESCRKMWAAFESVIAKMSNRKYKSKSSMRQVMNRMLFNELSRRKITVTEDLI